jgi:hypothetical protein
LEAGTAAAAAAAGPEPVVELVTSGSTDEDTKLEMEGGAGADEGGADSIKYKIHFLISTK